jgi:hypothetical protein
MDKAVNNIRLLVKELQRRLHKIRILMMVLPENVDKSLHKVLGAVNMILVNSIQNAIEKEGGISKKDVEWVVDSIDGFNRSFRDYTFKSFQNYKAEATVIFKNFDECIQINEEIRILNKALK